MDPILETLKHIPPSTLGHFLDEGFLDIEIRPIFRPIALVGRAFTISAPPRDNGIYRRALRECQPGDVLVIHRGGDLRHASFGGNLGLAAKNCGIAGAVLDGPVTDLVELTEIRLPVFARGVSALTTRRLDLGGTIGEPIVCGGVHVAHGDYVVADDDGVLIIPASRIEAVLEQGRAARQREKETWQWLSEGKTLDDLDAIRRKT
jgi:4-hydroxy-4-methyl-2-oxoglutarate aldolase